MTLTNDLQNIVEFTETLLGRLPSPGSEAMDVHVGSHRFPEPGVFFNQIHLPTKHLVALWHAACLMRLTYAATHASFKHEADFHENVPLRTFDPRIPLVAGNLENAINQIHDTQSIEQPELVDLSESERNEIEYIYSSAFAWQIYHESAHQELGHTQNVFSDSKDVFVEELEADSFAVRKLEEVIDRDKHIFTARFGQIAAAVAVMFIETRSDQSPYPFPEDRIFCMMEIFDLEPNAEEYLVVNNMLRLKAMTLGLDPSHLPAADSLEDAFNAHVDLIRGSRNHKI